MATTKQTPVLTKSKERISKYGEVFTPDHIVNDMLGQIPDEMFQPEPTFLEPCVGEGAFIIPLLERKFKNCKKRKDYTVALESVYGMEIQADNVKICIDNILKLCDNYFKPTKKEREIINNHIIQADSLKVMRMINDMNTRGDNK